MEFMNDNPAVEGYPLSYTNDPEIIARNDKMISINTTLQVDLTGQCNSEYLEGAQFSATGGQLDFVRGAFNSKGGKSILTFRSTARNNTVSRIVPPAGLRNHRHDAAYGHALSGYGIRRRQSERQVHAGPCPGHYQHRPS